MDRPPDFFVVQASSRAASLVVLALDMIARLVMVESPPKSKSAPTSSAASTASDPNEDNSESRALLAGDNAATVTGYQSTPEQANQDLDLSTSSAFYRAMLTNGRVVTALLISTTASCVIASFDATLSLHIRDVFGLGPSTTGMVFFCLDIHCIFVALAPLLWLLGVPGDDHFPWASTDTRGFPIYVSSIVGIGAVMPFLFGVGTLELTAVVTEHAEKNPHVFGAHGGFARAYSVSDVATSVAMMLGPIIAGWLHQAVGYYYMNLIFAIVLLALSVFSFCFLGRGQAKKQDIQ